MAFKLVSQEKEIALLEITATQEEWGKVYNRELNKAAADKSLKIPGFRPGKVPLPIVQEYRGRAVQENTLNFFRDQGIQEFAKSTDLIIASLVEAKVDFREDNKEEFLVLEVKLEVVEPFDLDDLSFLNIKRPVINTDEAVDEMVLALRQQRSVQEDYDGAAELDDTVLFTAVAKDENGEPYAPLSSEEPRTLVLGNYQAPEAFTTAFLGKKAGDEFTFNYTVDGQDAAESTTYEIEAKVVKVTRRKLPEVNEAFVEEFLGRPGDIDTLRADIRKNIVREIKLNSRRFVEPQVVGQLLEHFENKALPESLLKYKAEQSKVNQVRYIEEQIKRIPELGKNLNVEELLQTMDFESIARQELIQEYCLRSLASKVTVTPEEVEAFIRELSIMFETPEQFVNTVLKDSKQYAQHANEVTQAKIIEYVLEHANVTDEEMSYTHLVRLINARQQAAQG